MTSKHTGEPIPQATLRLWPGIVAAVLLVLVRVVLPVAAQAEWFGFDSGFGAVIGGMVFAAAIVVWWAFFSRAPWSDRLGRDRLDDRRTGGDAAPHPSRRFRTG